MFTCDMLKSRRLGAGPGGILLACFLGCLSWGRADDTPRGPVVVKIQDDQPTVIESGSTGPVDPVQRIRIMPQMPQQPLNINISGEQGQTLQLSHFPAFNIDGQFVSPLNALAGGRIEMLNGKLPKTPAGKNRVGYMTVYVRGDLRLTLTVEVTPTKPPGPGQKRQLDAVLIRYVMENKGTQNHKIGLRVYMDAYIVDNDGALFAAPTVPNKVLDGVELKEKTLPDYFQILQRPDLKNPGYVAHATLNMGSALERPNRVVFTRHGLGLNTWEMMPAMAGGDSAMGIFWDPKDIKAGGKRELAYAYGKGIAVPLENEGRFNLVLGGSFEPGKLFTIAAYVQDPALGQSLTLELPPGMERVEGKEIQPVAPAAEERPQSMVLWKARVLRTGRFPLRVRSSTGLTQTKLISITSAEEDLQRSK
ncbi:MAG TPA: hypothetical protein VNX28_06710 [Gemmataceae bacterium]|nr:hypothetical protein [Gemmataceae bacterium]